MRGKIGRLEDIFPFEVEVEDAAETLSINGLPEIHLELRMKRGRRSGKRKERKEEEEGTRSRGKKKVGSSDFLDLILTLFKLSFPLFSSILFSLLFGNLASSSNHHLIVDALFGWQIVQINPITTSHHGLSNFSQHQ